MPSYYLDCCVLQRPFDLTTQPRVALEAEALTLFLRQFDLGLVEIVSSEVLLLECSRIPQGPRHTFVEIILSRVHRHLIINQNAEAIAREYQKQEMTGLDALHLACAVDAEIDYFCTCDVRFMRKAQLAETKLTQVISVLQLIES